MDRDCKIIVQNLIKSESIKGKEETFTRSVLQAVDSRDEKALYELGLYKKYHGEGLESRSDNISKYLHSMCRNIENKYNL